MSALERCLEKLHKHIMDSGLFAIGDKLLLAVSGGSDSVALLCLLARLRSHFPITLLCCHVNHGLRGAASDADEELVRDLCLRLNVPVIVRKVKIKPGADLENRARNERFGALFQLLKMYRFDYILLGHQRDDQAETVLMNMLRGCGIGGLAGIKADQGKVLHPLLDFGREELREMLKDEGVLWNEDATNMDTGFRRNLIRLELIPYLQQNYSADLVHKLQRQSGILADADEYFVLQAQALYKKLANKAETDSISFEIPALQKISRIELYYLFKQAYQSVSGAFQDFFYHSFDGVLQLMEGDGSASLDLQNNVIALREYNVLSFQDGDQPPCDWEPVSVEEDRSRVVYGNYRFIFKHIRILPRVTMYDPNRVVLNSENIQWPLQIRMREPGDRFIPAGMTQTKKLKDFFIDIKVPKRLRDQVPILCDGEKILWVVGHRVDARVLASEDSAKLLQIVVEPTNVKPKRPASRIKQQGGTDESDEFGYFGSPF